MTAAAADAVCRRVLFAFIYLLYYVAGAQNHRGIRRGVYNGNGDLALLRSSLRYDFYRSQKFRITVPCLN